MRYKYTGRERKNKSTVSSQAPCQEAIDVLSKYSNVQCPAQYNELFKTCMHAPCVIDHMLEVFLSVDAAYKEFQTATFGEDNAALRQGWSNLRHHIRELRRLQGTVQKF